MVVTNESWYIVRNTPNVTGFLGAGNVPVPVSGEELDMDDAQGGHIASYSSGGKTEYDNLQVIGKITNIKKSSANNEDYINKIA